MRRAKTIEELYSDAIAKGCDFVVTVDIALASALNRQIDRPRVGPFAMTPRQIAKELGEELLKKPLVSDLELIRGLSKETGYDLRFVYGEVENIREIRRYRADVRSYLSSGSSAEKILKYYQEYPTIEKVMDLFEGPVKDSFFRRFKKVGVIGLGESYDDQNDRGFFNDLEKHFYPDVHEEIDRFVEDSEFNIDTIYEIGNDRQLAANAVAMITGDPSEYAIVINTDSPLVSAVRSALFRQGIPFVNSKKISDDETVKEFLEFCEFSTRYDTLYVHDIKTMFKRMEGRISAGKDEYLLSKLGKRDMDRTARDLRETMANAHDMVFSELLDELYQEGAELVNDILVESGFSGERITSRAVSELRYLINNVSGFRCSEDLGGVSEGVLIADCTNSTYIDRSAIIYLGLDQDWNRVISGKKYIDVENESYSEMNRFTILLQQGDVRGYLVNTTKGGRDVRPCITFDDIFKEEVKSFSQVVPGGLRRGRWVSDTEEACLELGPIPESFYEHPLSDSKLGKFMECPRAFMYDVLVETKDKDVLKFGSLLHEFAEAYTTNQSLVDRSRDKVDEYIYDSYSGLSSPATEELDRGTIEYQLDNIRRFVGNQNLDPPLDRDVMPDGKRENEILIRLDAKKKSSICEMDLEHPRCPIHGKYDLLCGNRVVDYKTGRMKTVGEVVDGMDFRNGKGHLMLQPYFYMLITEHLGVNRFTYLYTSGNDVESLESDFDVNRNAIDIYRYKGALEDAEVEQLREVVKHDGFEILARTDYVSTFYYRCLMKVTSSRTLYDAKLFPSGCPVNDEYFKKTLFPMVKKSILSGLAFSYDSIVVPESKMEDFVSFVIDVRNKINQYSRTDFPEDHSIKCKDCVFRCLCIRGDEDE